MTKKKLSPSAIKAQEALRQLKQKIEAPAPKREEGWALPMMLDATVPLWIETIKSLTPEQRLERITELNSDGLDFCLRMEYVLHKGPKEGDTAKAFNDLAKAIALLSFCPGGVHSFGRHWETRL
jgi:hypothetical protein